MKTILSNKYKQAVFLIAMTLLVAPSIATAGKRVDTEIVSLRLVMSDREHEIKVTGIDHEVISPRDAASGLPTGKRQHKPFSITKPIDRATPLLYRALLDNENIGEWILQVHRTVKKGEPRPVRTIQLVKPWVCGIGTTMGMTNNHMNKFHSATRKSFGHLETVV